MRFPKIFGKRFNRRDELDNPFDNLLSKGLVKEIDDINIRNQGLQNLEIVFLLIQFRDERFDDIVDAMDQLFSEVLKHGGFWERMFSTIALVTLGCRPEDNHENPINEMHELVKSIVERFKDDVRIVYGRTKGYYGTASGIHLHEYGAVIPQIEEKLKILFDTEFGTASFIDDEPR